MTAITVNGNSYSDDGSMPHDMQYGGFQTNLLPMLGDTMIDAASKVTAAQYQVELANAAAAAAALSASTAVTGPGSSATSTATLTQAMGTQSLTIQTGKTLVPGMPITIASTASPRDWMNGTLLSYDSGTGALVVNVTNLGFATPGAPVTASAWTISLSGVAASTGVVNEAKGADIAAAPTINLTTSTGNLLHITGSGVTIAAVTIPVGAERTIIIDGANTLAHSASLQLPGKANITTAANDRMVVRGDTAGAIVVSYNRANGMAVLVTPPMRTLTLMTQSGTWVAPADGFMRATLIGAQGSGGVALEGATGSAAASGAGQGGLCIKSVPVKAGDTFVAMLAAGGGENSVNTTGTAHAGFDGGSSTITGPGVNMVANGGHGGNASRSTSTGVTAAPAEGGTASGGDLNVTGGPSGTANAQLAGAAATGSGSVGWNGTGYASGDANASANYAAASGGAGTGGKSGNVTASTSRATSGGGSAIAASADSTNTVAGAGAPAMPTGISPPVLMLNAAGAPGQDSSIGGASNSSPGPGGGGGGGVAATNSGASGGVGSLLSGGGGAAATQETSYCAAGNGGAAAATTTVSSILVRAGVGADARAIFEWTEA